MENAILWTKIFGLFMCMGITGMAVGIPMLMYSNDKAGREQNFGVPSCRGELGCGLMMGLSLFVLFLMGLWRWGMPT